tara:strand:+ start:11391 stop:12218 length:828 start_codon:yes stop_codon:yes gene_type:complete
MNLSDACRYLDITTDDIYTLSEKQLKHKYHIKALKYHPDKNKSLDAKHHFQELQEAYSIICDARKIPNYKTDYKSMLSQYLSFYIKDSDIIVDILYKKLNIKLEEWLQKCSRSRLTMIYTILLLQKEMLHVSDDVLIKLKEIIHSKTNNIEIQCSFKDIWEQNIYVLNIDNETIYIPLWHSIIEYEIEGKQLIITCSCTDNYIVIDRNNNVFITISKMDYKDNICTLPVIGKKHIPMSKINNNKIVLKGEGIPKMNTNNIYDNTKKGDIIITLLT